MRPVIVLNRDGGAGTKTSVTSISFLEGGVGNVTPKLGLGEGEQILDRALYQKLKTKSKEPELILPMRVGCGVFGYWHGYSGGGADVDQALGRQGHGPHLARGRLLPCQAMFR